MNAETFHKLMAVRQARFEIPDYNMVLLNSKPITSFVYSAYTPWASSGRESSTSIYPATPSATYSLHVVATFNSFTSSKKLLVTVTPKCYIPFEVSPTLNKWSGVTTTSTTSYFLPVQEVGNTSFVGYTGGNTYGRGVRITTYYDYSNAVYTGTKSSTTTATTTNLNKEANWDISKCKRYFVLWFYITSTSYAKDGSTLDEDEKISFTTSSATAPVNYGSVSLSSLDIYLGLKPGVITKQLGTGVVGNIATYLNTKLCIRDKRWLRPIDAGLHLSFSKGTWKKDGNTSVLAYNNDISWTAANCTVEPCLYPDYPDLTNVVTDWQPYTG